MSGEIIVSDALEKMKEEIRILKTKLAELLQEDKKQVQWEIQVMLFQHQDMVHHHMQELTYTLNYGKDTRIEDIILILIPYTNESNCFIKWQ